MGKKYWHGECEWCHSTFTAWMPEMIERRMREYDAHIEECEIRKLEAAREKPYG